MYELPTINQSMSLFEILTLSALTIMIIIMVSSYIAHIQKCSVRFTHITPGHWTCSFVYHFNSLFLEHTALAAISALGTSRTHCHLYPTRYSFTPEASEACEGKVPCLRTQHRRHHFTSLKTDLIFLQLGVLERKFP